MNWAYALAFASTAAVLVGVFLYAALVLIATGDEDETTSP